LIILSKVFASVGVEIKEKESVSKPRKSRILFIAPSSLKINPNQVQGIAEIII
jgi:hypothetical protein